VSAERTTQARGGLSVAGLLGVAFIVLKLIGVISWSWWWVLAPFWGPVALWLLVMAALSVAIGLVTLFESRQQRKVRKARKALRAYEQSLRGRR
jgi:phosphoglycerol transferase MdoB-like AlkP superfamily enzyme